MLTLKNVRNKTLLKNIPSDRISRLNPIGDKRGVSRGMFYRMAQFLTSVFNQKLEISIGSQFCKMEHVHGETFRTKMCLWLA